MIPLVRAGLAVPPAGTVTYVSDTFTRANSTTSMGTADTGQAWTASVGTWGINTNRAYVVTSGSSENFALIDAAHANVILSADLIYDGTAGKDWQRVAFRATDANNLYIAQIQNSNGFQIYKRVSGTYTQIGSGNGGVTAFTNGQSYHVDIILSGSSIVAKLDGVTAWSLTDSTFPSGTLFGISAALNSNMFWDNFKVTS